MSNKIRSQKILELLKRAQNGGLQDDRELALKSVEFAEELLILSKAEMTYREKHQANKMSRLINDPKGKLFTLALTDRVFRPISVESRAKVFHSIVKEFGIPQYLTPIDKLLLKIGDSVAESFPDQVISSLIKTLRKRSESIILPAEQKKISAHVNRREKAGLGSNLNILGERVLGENEANERLERIISELKNDYCKYISVKISSIFSQINLIDFEGSVVQIQQKLRKLFRVAQSNQILLENKHQKAKFITLEIEEYKDLYLTKEIFQRTLMEDEFLKLSAGIVLQAYLPDSFLVLEELISWSQERVKCGGAPIKIRLVKGGNLTMEKVDAALHQWPQAPYQTKCEVDANYKRMLHAILTKETGDAIQLGVASHNLFDLSYAILLAKRENSIHRLQFEMLEGMINAQGRVINSIINDVLLYTPIVSGRDFKHSITYSIRCLNEVTSKENFSHDLFGMMPGSAQWENQKQKFLRSCAEKDRLSNALKRIQNRKTEKDLITSGNDFSNESDTDWSLKENQEWIAHKISEQKSIALQDIPIVIDGKEIIHKVWGAGRDPSNVTKIAFKYALANSQDVENCLVSSCAAQEDWEKVSLSERKKILLRAANLFSQNREEIIASMVINVGKTIAEADSEVSQGIDFARYYAEGLDHIAFSDGVSISPLGTILVITPWNSPFAIPCGGILAAIMAGNCVIFKPAPEAVFVAWKLVNFLWDAGVPRKVLQFICTQEDENALRLVTDDRVNSLILTGSLNTAEFFLSKKVNLSLFAETSGKNAMVISATADLDDAIKNLIKSAFGYSGQQCSSTSLVLVEGEVYDNEIFRKKLKDAASSLPVSSAWQLNSAVTTIIRTPSENLKRALTTLEEGEEWLLEPKMVDEKLNLWSLGIKLGVKVNSWFQKTECFGPVLGIIRVNNLQEAVEIQNQSKFGLTGGLHSLDDKEIHFWKENVNVGNIYINKSTTDVIVQRQPFGGWKKSCFGFGAKTGGPNYLTQFVHWKENELPSLLTTPQDSLRVLLERLCRVLPEESGRLRAAAGSLFRWWKEEFSKEHDPCKIFGESNVFRYRAFKKILLRTSSLISDGDIGIVMMAAQVSNIELEISLGKDRRWLNEFNSTEIKISVESPNLFLERLPKIGIDALRCVEPSKEIFEITQKLGIKLFNLPILANGRIEFLRYFKEQTISETTHRFGNIIPKQEEIKH